MHSAWHGLCLASQLLHCLGEWPVPDSEPATVAALESGKPCVSVSSGLSENCFWTIEKHLVWHILDLVSRNFCLEIWGRSLPSLLASPVHLLVWHVLLRRFCSCLPVRAGLWDLHSPSARCFSGEQAGWLPLDRPRVSSPPKYREWFWLCLSPEAWWRLFAVARWMLLGTEVVHSPWGLELTGTCVTCLGPGTGQYLNSETC